MSTNYLSIALAVTGSEVAHEIGVATVPMNQVTGIQNNTGEDITMKFNGGAGAFVLKDLQFFEPFTPIKGTFTITGLGAGTCTLLG